MLTTGPASLLPNKQVNQLSKTDLDNLFKITEGVKYIVDKDGGMDLLKHRVMTALFYEPSTRTRCSFQTAMLRLGGEVVVINDLASSSISKGETLSDTVRCLECYSDVIVLRHPEKGKAAEAASHLKIPLLNAGDGVGEHPTQALLDAYTILSEHRKHFVNALCCRNHVSTFCMFSAFVFRKN